MGIKNSAAVDHISNYASLYRKYKEHQGVTDNYKFDDPEINLILGGGIGRVGSFELCLIYGSSGAGKSLLAENLVWLAARKHEKICLMSLENDPAQTYGQLQTIFDDDKLLNECNMEFIGREQLKERFTIADVGAEIRRLYNEAGCDIVVLDHIQELLDLATREDSRDDNPNDKVRKFMQEVQDAVSENRKTLVIVAHTNKSKIGGMESIYGSSALYQKATTVIEINKDPETGKVSIKCHKNRNAFVPPHDPLRITYKDRMRIHSDLGIE